MIQVRLGAPSHRRAWRPATTLWPPVASPPVFSVLTITIGPLAAGLLCCTRVGESSWVHPNTEKYVEIANKEMDKIDEQENDAGPVDMPDTVGDAADLGLDPAEAADLGLDFAEAEDLGAPAPVSACLLLHLRVPSKRRRRPNSSDVLRSTRTG